MRMITHIVLLCGLMLVLAGCPEPADHGAGNTGTMQNNASPERSIEPVRPIERPLEGR